MSTKPGIKATNPQILWEEANYSHKTELPLYGMELQEHEDDRWKARWKVDQREPNEYRFQLISKTISSEFKNYELSVLSE